MAIACRSLLAFCRLNYHKNWSNYQVRDTGEGAFDGQGQEDDFLNVGGINIFRGDDEVDDDSDDEDYDSSDENDDDSDDEDYNSSEEDDDNSDDEDYYDNSEGEDYNSSNDDDDSEEEDYNSSDDEDEAIEEPTLHVGGKNIFEGNFSSNDQLEDDHEGIDGDGEIVLFEDNIFYMRGSYMPLTLKQYSMYVTLAVLEFLGENWGHSH